ncbi:MAG: hypothetical protein ACYTBP_13190 [Planctomycetota bacterium]|jgi:hypothetical protein
MAENGVKIENQRKFHFWYIPAVILVLLISSFIYLRYVRKSEIREKLEVIKAEGYPVTLQELNDWYSIPDNVENAADYFTDAFSYYIKWDNESLEQLPVVGKAELPGRTEPLTEETKRIISEYLADNSKALELLHKGASIKHCRYPINFNQGFAILLPDLREIRHGCKILQIEAIVYAENNEAENAIESVNAIFGLAGSLKNEPILVSYLVHRAVKTTGVSAIERILNRVSLTDEQLVYISEILSNAYNPSGLSRAMAGERCFVIDLLRYFDTQKYPSISGGLGYSDVFIALYRAAGLSDKDLNLYLDLLTGYIEAAKLPWHKRCKAVELISKNTEQIPKIQVFLRKLNPVLFDDIITRDIRRIAQMHTAEVAVAIERYRLSHDKLPESLTELVPDYFESVPKDPFDGKVLRYEKLSKGFVVYSVNEDGFDDGGRERPKDKNDDSNYDITFIVER